MTILCSKCGCEVSLNDVEFSADQKPLCKSCSKK